MYVKHSHSTECANFFWEWAELDLSFPSEGKHKGQSCRQRSDSTALVPALRCYCDKRWVMLSRDSGFSLPRPRSLSFPSSSFSPFLFIKEKVFSVCWLNRYSQEASTVTNHFATGIPSEKCNVRTISVLRERHRVHLHKPRWSDPLHTSAVWHSLSLPGHRPARHVTAQNNTRCHQAQEKWCDRETRPTRDVWGHCQHRMALFYSILKKKKKLSSKNTL